jgi:hypothetical protein
LKHTPQTHPDYHDLIAAIEKIEVSFYLFPYPRRRSFFCFLFKTWMRLIVLMNLQHVTNELNESERQAENMNKIFKIQEKLDGEYQDLLQPHRRLCKEGQLLLVKQKEVKVHIYYVKDYLIISFLHTNKANTNTNTKRSVLLTC